MKGILEWWSQPAGKRYVVALALLGAFAAGGFSLAPETRTAEKVIYRDRLVEKKDEKKAEAKRVIVYRDRVIKPDGTRHETEVERTETDTRTEAVSIRTEDREGVRKTEVTVTPARQDWRVGLQVGASSSLDRLAPSLVVGASVDRRLVGPFSVGVWALVQPAPVVVSAGASVSVSW